MEETTRWERSRSGEEASRRSTQQVGGGLEEEEHLRGGGLEEEQQVRGGDIEEEQEHLGGDTLEEEVGGSGL
jgi:hypothetical protein